ncbi:MAG: hypothetical protein QOE19_1340 [Actinomycetota bacterium]|nr:hypothetical protein [Actinomycetota bacterium]
MRQSRRGRLPYVVTGALCSALAAMSLGAIPAAGAAAGTVAVTYQGVSVAVPSDWPVLDVDGATGCVRFDRHAVYLGDPKNSSCPADLTGHVEAVHISQGGVTDARSPLAREGSGRTVTGGTAIHPDFVVSHASSPVRVIVTSGPQPATARTIADSVRYDKAKTGQAFKGFSRPSAAAPKALSAPQSGPSAQSRQSVSGSPARAGAASFSGLGFDACTAPSLNAMNAWLASPYRAVNIYIGGASRGCSQLALNSDWVSTVVGMGWTLIPTYVGLQAPCSTYPNRVDPASAAAQGSASADDAIAILTSLGLGTGSVVYFDMEAFDYTNASCLAAVQTFLDSWTVRLHARNYLSGIYTSSNTMKATLVDKQGDATFHQPDDIWFARWNNNSSTTGDPAIPDQFWADHQRIHQYRGGHTETWGGVTINIDNDSVDADTAPGAPLAEGTFVRMAGASDVYRIAGGAPLRVSNWAHFGGPQPVVDVTRTRFTLLPQYPRNGTFLQVGATGRVFRVNGGVASFVPSWDAFGGPQPTTTVDAAALDLAGTGGVWNHLKSGKPAVQLTAPASPFTTASSTRLTWQGAITSSAIKNYDVRYQKARWNGVFGSWTYLKSWQRTASSGKNKSLPRGTNYCFSVRAHNRAGAATGWTPARCLSRALDDRSLTASKGWTRAKKSGFYDRTYTTTARKGATLTLRSARIARLALVATTCASCGTVRVAVKGKYVGTVSLYSPTTKRQQILSLPRFSRRVGNVELRVTSANGKRVQIDGLALGRT